MFKTTKMSFTIYSKNPSLKLLEIWSELWQDFRKFGNRMDAVWPRVRITCMDGFDKK